MKPITVVEHAVNSLRKRGYVVQKHTYYDYLIDIQITGYVVYPNTAIVYDLSTLPHYSGQYLIEIAERKRREAYVKNRKPITMTQYDLLESLARASKDHAKSLIDINEKLDILSKRLN